MSKPIIKFSTYKYVDLKTLHITQNDSILLVALAKDDNFPLSITEYAEGFFIPLGEGREWYNEILPDLKEWGLSNEFQELVWLCVDKRVSLLRLDRDGEEVDGLPIHDW